MIFWGDKRQIPEPKLYVFWVSQRRTDLIAARGRELQAQTDLNKAISEFQRATGTTLSANNVSVTDGGNLQKSPARRFDIANTRSLVDEK